MVCHIGLSNTTHNNQVCNEDLYVRTIHILPVKGLDNRTCTCMLLNGSEFVKWIFLLFSMVLCRLESDNGTCMLLNGSEFVKWMFLLFSMLLCR